MKSGIIADSFLCLPEGLENSCLKFKVTTGGCRIEKLVIASENDGLERQDWFSFAIVSEAIVVADLTYNIVQIPILLRGPHCEEQKHCHLSGMHMSQSRSTIPKTFLDASCDIGAPIMTPVIQLSKLYEIQGSHLLCGMRS